MSGMPHDIEMIQERDIAVRMRDGVHLSSDIYRPASQGRYPVLYASALHNKDLQGPDIAETSFGNAYYQNYNSTNALGGSALPSPDNQKSYNQIYIDPLTGRAKVQRLQIQ